MLAVCLPLLSQAAPAAIPLDIRLDLRGETPVEMSGKLLLSPLDRGDVSTAGAIELDFDATVVRATLPSAGQWRLCAWMEGWWSPCRPLTLGPTEDDAVRQVTLDLWPSAWLAGRLTTAENTAFPDTVRVEFSPSDPVRREPPASEVACPVGDGGTWRCAVPAGRIDLVVRPVGFVPSYRWAAEPEAGEVLDLGQFELRRGASLVGRVEVEGGGLTEGETFAALIPAVAGGFAMGDAQRVSEVRHRSLVDPRGFFQIVGIPAGTYLLEVTQPGMAPSRIVPVTVLADSETALGAPVVLRPPVTVTLRVEPPNDTLGRPWRISWTPASDAGGRVEARRPAEGMTDAEGVVEFPDQTPGVFVVRVEDSTGKGFHFDPSFTVRDELDADRRIEIEMVTAFGRVSLGGEPLGGASLWFGGRHGGVSVETQADEDGLFTEVLPRAGRWRVHVESAEPPVRARVEVEVEPDRNGFAEMELALPDTELFGTVVDSEGNPVAGARVGLQSTSGSASADSEADGGFTIRGFEPGPVRVSARKSVRRSSFASDSLLAVVDENAPYGPTRLQLFGSRQVEGRVTGVSGEPISGATLQVSTSSPATALFIENARTDVDGRFTVRVREGVERLKVVVLGLGYPLSVREMAATEALDLQLEPGGGNLAIDVSALDVGDADGLLVRKDGLTIPLGLLWQWARSHGQTLDPAAGLLMIPAMPSAHYSACTHDSRRAVTPVEPVDEDASATNCAGGFLTSGSTLLLGVEQLPDQPGEE